MPPLRTHGPPAPGRKPHRAPATSLSGMRKDFLLGAGNHSGARRAGVLPDRRGQSLVALLTQHIGRDAILCAPMPTPHMISSPGTRLSPHCRFHSENGPKVIQRTLHIQTINTVHRRFKDFMDPFCGPATRDLPGYAAWFIPKLTAGEEAAQREAWQRLLAARSTRNADIGKGVDR